MPSAPIVGHVATLLIMSVVFYTLYRLVLFPRYLSPLRNMPGPSMGNPILGQYQQIADPAFNNAWATKYGSCFRVMGPLGSEAIVVMAPEALDQILVKDWVFYPRPQFFRNIMWLGVGRGLTTAIGNDHKRMRAAQNPAFSALNLCTFEDACKTSITRLLATVQAEVGSGPGNGKVVQIYSLGCTSILDMLCTSIFGQSIDSSDHKLAVAFERLRALEIEQNLWRVLATSATCAGTRHALSRWVYRHRHWVAWSWSVGPLAGFSEAVTEIRNGLKALIPRDDKIPPDGLLHILTSESASDSELINHLRVFIAAGQGTVSTALASTLYFLANDAECQRMLREELAPVFENDSTPSDRDLKNLKWLNCVINESLRVNTPFPVVVREATKTASIGGVLVPKGTVLVIPIEAINTRREVWGPDTDVFRPSRWLDLPPDYNPKFSTLTFLAGPLHCMGRSVAMMQLRMIIASLIHHFEFLPPFPGYLPDTALLVTKHPRDKMPLLVRRVISKA
ncbi:cytochrome P450 [Mycena polygramma]|nr:cytochrome P450 [Mycena polygramma]